MIRLGLLGAIGIAGITGQVVTQIVITEVDIDIEHVLGVIQRDPVVKNLRKPFNTGANGIAEIPITSTIAICYGVHNQE